MAGTTAGQLFPDAAARLRTRFEREGTSPGVIEEFHEIVLAHHGQHGREFPFRHPDHYADPYKVVVSEIMLQQTQAGRVSSRYLEFVARFPTFDSLASASNEDVLKAWIGLGYNRRALALKRIAEQVVASGGVLPRDPAGLQQFPHVGPNTAASIAAFAFNHPSAFIETNIREVFTHFFFHGKDDVDDKAILELVEVTLDREDPRTWYYALMDYGVMLKQTTRRHRWPRAKVRKHEPFKGSMREARGTVLKVLVERGEVAFEDMVRVTGVDPARLRDVLAALVREGFIAQTTTGYRVS